MKINDLIKNIINIKQLLIQNVLTIGSRQTMFITSLKILKESTNNILLFNDFLIVLNHTKPEIKIFIIILINSSAI